MQAKRKFIFLFLITIFSKNVFAQSKGENLFKQNKPEQAIVELEKEIREGSASASAYNFLGLSYFQLGEYEKSVNAFESGMNMPQTNKKILLYNQGNSYYAMRKFQKACDNYTLVLNIDDSFTQALLNRANTYIMLNELEKALSDYETYIEKNADDEQKDQIEKMIEALKKAIQQKKDENQKMEELKKLQQEKENEVEWEKIDDDDLNESDENLNQKKDESSAKTNQSGADENNEVWEKIDDDAASEVEELNERTRAENEKRLKELEEERKSIEEEIKKIEEERRKLQAERLLLESERRQSGQSGQSSTSGTISGNGSSSYDYSDAGSSYSSGDYDAYDSLLNAQMEEAEKRRKLIEDIEKSLQNKDSTNLTSGSENIMDFDGESELD